LIFLNGGGKHGVLPGDCADMGEAYFEYNSCGSFNKDL